MNFDLPAATAFLAGHARLLDRRRFELLVDDAEPDAALAALEACRNPDGGYGWGMEPDLRSQESQPGGALHAFEVFEDIAPATSPRALELCEWLESVTVPDGGLPFALPVTDPAGCAPFWASADPEQSSLQITAYVASVAHRVAAHDAAVASHPWPARAADYCFAAIEAIGEQPFAIALSASLQFLDAAHDTRPEAAARLEQLGRFVPADGLLAVAGGAEGEVIRPLDYAPTPDRPVRALLGQETIDAELERLAGEQRDDGGWEVDFQSYSPAAELEWRGYATVRAVSVLRRNAATAG